MGAAMLSLGVYVSVEEVKGEGEGKKLTRGLEIGQNYRPTIADPKPKPMAGGARGRRSLWGP